jgi:hypothetical protein
MLMALQMLLIHCERKMNNNIFLTVLLFIFVFSSAAGAVKEPKKAPYYVYSAKNEESSIKIIYLSRKIIQYELFGVALKNIEKSCVTKGRAINEHKGDSEVNVDEENVLYPVSEYVYDNGLCYVAIRINSLTKKRLSFCFMNCPESSRATCKMSVIEFKTK